MEAGTQLDEIIGTKALLSNSTQIERGVQFFSDYGGINNYNVILGGKINSFYAAGQFALEKVLGQ